MDGLDGVVAILVGAIRAGTPLVFAALGELISEKSGVLNLGVEGMMLLGAVAGFIAAVATGIPYIGVLASIVAGAAMSLIFGFLTLPLLTNQVATGLRWVPFRGRHLLMGLAGPTTTGRSRSCATTAMA